MNFELLDGSLNAIIQTPCNALNIPLTVVQDQIVTEPDKFVATAKGCIDDAGEKEAWTTTFLKSPITFELPDQALRLTNSSANITFSRSPPDYLHLAPTAPVNFGAWWRRFVIAECR
ncbi:hypothetical protein [Subtercola boreus]|uniref:hypothetical protein n=1 Tax=Subtercola boreus TaxID=120213 RepID=UPI0011C070BC|nr:hypothetical protein [Subtercola boreus]